MPLRRGGPYSNQGRCAESIESPGSGEQAGIEARRKRKFRLAYQARNTAPAPPNLLRWPFTAAYPDQIWVTDVTFIPTRSGWLYLAVMIDLYTRLVVGWSMKDRPNQELANEALMMAVEQRRPKPGLIHHSDQGILYSSGSYRRTAEKIRDAAQHERQGQLL